MYCPKGQAGFPCEPISPGLRSRENLPTATLHLAEGHATAEEEPRLAWFVVSEGWVPESLAFLAQSLS